MAELEPNDAYQDRGLVKLTDGSYVVDITSDGELKTKADQNLISTSGGQQVIFVQDDETRNLLNSVLKELKIMNLHLTLMTDCHLKNEDVEV